MNQLLISVLMATTAVLALGAALLLALISLAGGERSGAARFFRRLVCRLSFDRLGCCDVAGKAA